MITGDMVATVTDETFESEVIQAHGLVMVDFWAAWCGPCRAIAPLVEQLASDYAGQVKVGKLDADANPHTMSRFGVRNLPSILFFDGGTVVDRVIGAVPRGTLEAPIRNYLKRR